MKKWGPGPQRGHRCTCRGDAGRSRSVESDAVYEGPLRSEPDRAPHIGNVRTALFNWLLARGQGGALSCVSKIPTRTIDDRSEATILDDLRGSRSIGTRGRTSAGPSGHIGSPSGSANISAGARAARTGTCVLLLLRTQSSSKPSRFGLVAPGQVPPATVSVTVDSSEHELTIKAGPYDLPNMPPHGRLAR